MINGRYILIGQTPVEEPDLLIWAGWFESANNRRVAFTKLPWCEVSTVFLGLDHNFSRFANADAPPILFETMVFWNTGEDGEEEQERCSTWIEAEAMHREMVAKITSSRGKKRLIQFEREEPTS